MTDIKKIARYYFLQGCKQGSKISKEEIRDEKALSARFEIIWYEPTHHRVYNNPEQLRDELYLFFADFMSVDVNRLYTKSREVPLPEIKMLTAFLTKKVLFEHQGIWLTPGNLAKAFNIDRTTMIHYLHTVESNIDHYNNFNISNSNIKSLYKSYLAHYQK